LIDWDWAEVKKKLCAAIAAHEGNELSGGYIHMNASLDVAGVGGGA
jgi:hypothetical protein